MYHILNAKGPAALSKEIASHFNVIMMAGAVTTATFLSGVVYYLGHNRQALSRLQDELRTKFLRLEAIDSKSLMDCVYVNAVVEEGLRIYPPAGAAHLSRIVPKGGCEISGSFIPEGVCSFVFLLLFREDIPTPSYPSALFNSNATAPHAHTVHPEPRISPPLVRPSGPYQLPCAVPIHPRALDRDHARRSKG